MAPALKFKFDPNQDYQLEAIAAVVDLFEGLPRYISEFALGDDAVANLPPYEYLDETAVCESLLRIQERNGIVQDRLLPQLEVDEGMVLDGAGNDTWRYPSFTVEMETGTGKTYVYLRTIHELRRRYGFRKFIVVVPSIAIYEGFASHFQDTKSHFASLYNNETVNLIRYDGSRLSELRGFARSTFVEVMVMTLASFNSKKNTIYRASESLPGERLPFQYIQDTRPILILDEPQNMESPLSLAALRTLHPLLALRYSATHRSVHNLVYRLTPFDAYLRNLVKKIQVDGVTERESFNRPYLGLEEIERVGGRIRARMRTRILEDGRTRDGEVTLYQGEDLQAKTLRDEHVAYVVSEIHKGEGYIEFENGEVVRLHEHIGPSRPDIFRVQIRRTLQEHMERQEQLRDQQIKVLSLFFIDRVANYVDDDGVIKRIFDEEFERLKANYPWFARFASHQVRNGYFAQRKPRGADEAIAVDTPIEESRKRKADREAEKAAFELIMRDKKGLLGFDEPVSFVFAHSALKEGWDNPNVFQICTLNQTRSEMKKRQEIGRGLRLAVNQSGERVFDSDVNVLTVVANESYDHYVSRLQTEYQEAGQAAPPKPTRVGKATAFRNDSLFTSGEFRRFWERISQLSQYDIQVDTDALIELAIERLVNDTTSLKPVIVVERGRYVVTEFRLTLEGLTSQGVRIRVESTSTDEQTAMWDRAFKVKDDLSKVLREERLRGFRIIEIHQDPPRVLFDNGHELVPGVPLLFHSEAGQKPVERTQLAPTEIYPVPNLLDRAASETGLTRATINRIFQRLPERKRRFILTNPEGFVGWFTGVVRGALADHIVGKLRFVVVGGGERPDFDKLFPKEKKFPQKELVPAGDHSLYDQVQVDSGVEENFVEHRLVPDDNVVCYFKFPPKFQVQLPKVVGNYNPDWGILRWSDERKQLLLELVRETKGVVDPTKLQFAHERRKVKAAKAHFRELGVDYRVVTDETIDWWEPEDEHLEIPG